MFAHPCYPEEDESCFTCLSHCVEATLCTAAYASILKTNAKKLDEKRYDEEREQEALRVRFARELQEVQDQKSEEELQVIRKNQQQQEAEELEKLQKQIFDPTFDDAELNCSDCCSRCAAGSAAYSFTTPFGFCFVVDDWVETNLRGSVIGMNMQWMPEKYHASLCVFDCIIYKKPFNNCQDCKALDMLCSIFGLFTFVAPYLFISVLTPCVSLAQVGRSMTRQHRFYGGICGGLCRKYRREEGSLSCCYCRYFLCPDCSTLPRTSVSVAFENRKIVFLIRQLGNGSTNTAMQLFNVMYLTAKYIDVTNLTSATSRYLSSTYAVME